jgi:serine protease Do
MNSKRLLLIPILLAVIASAASAQRGPTITERSRNSGTLKNAWMEVVAPTVRSTVRLRIDGKDVALGTIVSADGLILSKHSELFAAPTVVLHDGRELPAKLVGVSQKHDLALLRVEARDLTPAKFADAKNVVVGQFLASVGVTQAPLSLGVVSVPRRKIPGKGGLLGVRLEPAEGGVRIARVERGSGADRAGLRDDDLLLSIDDEDADSPDRVVTYLRERSPGDVVVVRVQRGDKEVVAHATLGERPTFGEGRNDIQNRMGGELSRRNGDFPEVIQHDTVLRPTDCGGPVVDLDGRVLGINIARAGRVESYAIPSDVLLPLIDELKSGKMPGTWAPQPQPAEPLPMTRPRR